MNRSSRRAAVLALPLAALIVVGCSSDTTTDAGSSTGTSVMPATSAPAAAGVEVGDPWARTSPMMASAGAVYMTLTSASGDTLINASVPATVAGMTQIHETTVAGHGGDTSTDHSDTSMMPGSSEEATPTTMMGSDSSMPSSGEMEMKPILSLELPSGDEVALAPGGYHIMLLDLVEPLVAGDTIEVTLTFERAGEMVVTVPVRDS